MAKKKEMVTIPKEEYEGLKSTVAILSDKEMMKDINESEKNRKKGKTFELNI